MEGISKPPYRAVVTVKYLLNDSAIATSAHGSFTRSDVKKIYKHIRSRGVYALYAERSTGHRLPKGEKVTEGPFAGLWRVLL